MHTLSLKIFNQAIQTLKELTCFDWMINEKGYLSMIPGDYFSGYSDSGKHFNLRDIILILKPFGVYPETVMEMSPNSHAFKFYFLIIKRSLEIKALAEKQLPPLNINADKTITLLKKITGHPEWAQEENKLYLKKIFKVNYSISDPREHLIEGIVGNIKTDLCLSASGEKNVKQKKNEPPAYGITVAITHPWELFQFAKMLDNVCYHISRFELMRRKANSSASQLPAELVIHLYGFLLQIYNINFLQPKAFIQLADRIFGKVSSFAPLLQKEEVPVQKKLLFTGIQTMFHNDIRNREQAPVQFPEQTKGSSLEK